MTEHMTELAKQVQRLQNDQVAMTRLGGATGITNIKNARKAFAIAVPHVLDAVGLYSRTDHGPGNLVRVAGSFEPAQRHSPALAIGEDQPQGSELSQHLFGPRLPSVSEHVADKAGIGSGAARAIVQNVSAVALATASGMTSDYTDPDALSRLLDGHGGRAASEGPTSAIGKAAAAAAAQEQPVRTKRQAAITSAEPTGRPADPAPVPAQTTNSSSKGKMVGAAAAALLLLGGLGFVLLGGGDDDATATVAAAETDNQDLGDQLPTESERDTEPEETVATPEPDPADTSSGQEDEAPEEIALSSDDPAGEIDTASETPMLSNAPDMSANESAPGIVSMTIPLRDILGISPESSGSIDFDFNTLTGEICYAIEADGIDAPFNSHIHSGDFGVKGGVVVDFGPHENGDTGCTDNLPADTLAILADPARHYAEIHDESGDWTLRGQLTEREDHPGIVPLEIPMRDITGTSTNASGVLSFDFNTITGEICYSVFSVGVDGPYNTHIHAGDFGVKGGVVIDFGPHVNGDSGCTENKPSDTLAILANPAGHYAEIHDESGDWTVRGQLTETLENPGIVSLSVPLEDIAGVAPEASGTMDLDFNTVTGEICFAVASEGITAPYSTHIHAGDLGVKGGVVVDFGPQSDGDSGCTANLPVDTLDILANPSGHYAELHDAAGVWTIRGQLSEALGLSDDVDTIAVVDTSGGGARLVLEGGTIYLEGEVADQATADELFGSLASAAVPVVNNLEVVPGSPLPSGRVIIADAIFFDSNSDELKDVDLGTLSALNGLVTSRPDWIVTVVGHTDSVGTEVANLELSLRRAAVLRDVLAFQGVPAENLRIRGAGETAPIGDNATSDGRAENRRIEFEFTPQ